MRIEHVTLQRKAADHDNLQAQIDALKEQLAATKGQPAEAEKPRAKVGA